MRWLPEGHLGRAQGELRASGPSKRTRRVRTKSTEDVRESRTCCAVLVRCPSSSPVFLAMLNIGSDTVNMEGEVDM